MVDEVTKKFVVFKLEDDSYVRYGGPYIPSKANEIKTAMKKHIANDNRSLWRIPEDAVDVELSVEPVGSIV